MAKNTYTLMQYNILAYQFAIRNPNVRELILSLDDEAIDHFLKHGIIDNCKDLSDSNAIPKSTKIDNYSNNKKHLNSVYYDLVFDYGLNLKDTLKYNIQGVTHPIESYNILAGSYDNKENDVDAYERISSLIESRGTKLERLINGEAFLNYDAVVLENKTIYSLDPTTNKKKTIRSDVEFITQWRQPDLYLQLIPQHY